MARPRTRLIEAAHRTSGRYPALLRKINSLPSTPDAEVRRHSPVADRLERVIRRGKASGEESGSGRMSGDEAADALRTSLLRLLGATP
ncbi:hypothetical protein AB0N89_23880 [Amycolatopsis sp. NPDC089917]|uniref:hypothetical protein n=1 Tax=Amycolatopsis sp. NPDC089917 TaxID=3155187 RepID=UPI003444D23E